MGWKSRAGDPIDAPFPGARFFNLEVVADGASVDSRRRILVRCDCGTEKLIRRCSWGCLKSCGCQHGARISEAQIRIWAERPDGYRARRRVTVRSPTQKSDRRLYDVWRTMVRRCTDPARREYTNYGGRGIAVCARWLKDFQAFARDMGTPMPGTQLDRVDNDKGYCPENCRWVSGKENQRNRRNTTRVLWDGRLWPISELAERYDIALDALHVRIKAGWSVERALTQPGARGYGKTRPAAKAPAEMVK
jgi:hypothetical protein